MTALLVVGGLLELALRVVAVVLLAVTILGVILLVETLEEHDRDLGDFLSPQLWNHLGKEDKT